MSVISDILGIDHFTTSKGSTVRRDFLEAVALRLGVPQQDLSEGRKDDVLRLAIEKATEEPMDPSLLSPGGTVTNRALQVLLDGLLIHGVAGRLEPAASRADGIEQLLAEDAFDPVLVRDERDRQLVQIATREGQDSFRNSLLDAYGERCAITGFDAPQALEAAHIYPYRGPATNKVSNGLLLRSDLHRLFDRGAIAVDEVSYRILLRPDLLATKYAYLADERATLRLPTRVDHRPSIAALRSHREWAGVERIGE